MQTPKKVQDFSKRNTNSELMDSFEMNQNELNINLLELEIINRWLGGYAVSFSGLSRLDLKPGIEYSVLDLGCGGGDGLIAMEAFLKKKHIHARFTGLDANPKALVYAQNRCKDYPRFSWQQAPFQNIDAQETDIFHCSLFAHHFYGEDLHKLVEVLGRARHGFVVNDLHRHPLAYYGISVLTRLFSRSYLVRHDARLSVAKGFSKTELQQLFAPLQAQFHLDLRWQWAFRWCLTGIRKKS
jgi:SAM-dependent methyltransferase